MSLRNKLLLSFVLTTILPILILGIGSFQTFKEALIKDRIDELKTIADLKVARIETFFQERRNNIEAIQDNSLIGSLFQTLVQFNNDRDSLAFETSKVRLDSFLRVTQVIYDYSDVMLVNTEGEIVYHSNAERETETLGVPLPDPGNKAFEFGREKIYITDPFISDRGNNFPALLVTGPLHDTSGKWLGLIAFELDMAPIYHFIQDTSGLGLTGETLLGRKVGKDALFLSPLRHDKTPILQRKARIGSKTAFPILEAVQGREGQGLAMDYRPKKIIAAWRYIPLLDWGMVAKIDTEEAFEPIET
ncbi:MAG: cache domain-containing protein, partial [Nitrospiria bacterium]